MVELTGSEMRKEDFVNEYMDVREASFRSSTIVSAFKKSGAWPINREVFTDDDFAPSIPYSTTARDFPSLPEFPDDSDESDSDSDSDRSDTESLSHHRNDSPQPRSSPLPTHEQHQLLAQSEPMPRSTSPITEQSQLQSAPSTSTTDAPSPVSTTQSTPFDSLIPVPCHRFYHDPILFERIQQLEKEVQRLSGHVKMVELELQNEKRKSNERDNRASKRRKLNVEARVLTSVEGRRLAAEKDAERIAKAQKKKETERRRKEKEIARNQQREARPADEPFVGSLGSKNKADLQEIAGALNLSEDGTKDTLIQRINSFFDSNPLQRDSARFSGLFRRALRRCPGQQEENMHRIASSSQNTLHHIHPPLTANIQNLPNMPFHPDTQHNYDNFFATLYTNP